MRLTVYHASLWLLGLVAFTQLVLVGVALASRGQGSIEPEVVERVVVQYLPSPAPVAERVPLRVEPRTPQPFSVPLVESAPPAPTPTSLDSRPAIQDPIVEALVREARAARVSGDLVLAILKLEEAQKSAPGEPNIVYEFGEVAELVGNHKKAGDYYSEVFAMGVTGAGGLYERAARKLSEGFGANDGRRGVEVSLGRILEFHDRRVVDGERVVLTIPILAAEGQVVDPDSIVPKVLLYDQVGEELVLAAETNPPQSRWVSEPVDYRSGEEQLRVTYFIPAVGAADEHLFGARKYFGHVVELYRDGELVDQKAWPRTLAAKVQARESDPLFLPEEYMPEDFNSENPLLPRLPR